MKSNRSVRRTYRNDPTSRFEALEGRQLMSAPGTLDPTFGKTGRIFTPLGFAAADMAVQSDGKMIVVGQRNRSFAVGRLNLDGTIDTSFGKNGVVTTDFGGKDHDEAQQVQITSRGQILVAGRANDDGFNFSRWVMARYNADGSLDKSFAGGAGKETWGGSVETDGILDMKLQSDGKIVFATDTATFDGLIVKFINYNSVVGRLNADGTIDNTFGEKLADGTRRGNFTIDHDDEDVAERLLVQSNGKIVIAAHGGNFGDFHNLYITRYTADGLPDTSFGDEGTDKIGADHEVFLDTMVEQPDGNFLLIYDQSGHDDVNAKTFMLRLESDGSIDPHFSADVSLPAGSGDQFGGELLSPQAGKFVLVGTQGSSTNRSIFVMQLNADFKRDSSFGKNGIAVIPANSADAIVPHVALSNDGKLDIAVGSTVARVVAAQPTVSLVVGNATATEGGAAGAVIFKRDAAYNFPTTIRFTTSGTATALDDYTGALAPTGLTLRGQKPRVSPLLQRVTIPAGQTSVTVPVNAVDDAKLEPAENVVVTAQPDSSFTFASIPLVHKLAVKRGGGAVGSVATAVQDTATISIVDNDEVHVNFQSPSNITAGKYVADTGEVFGTRSNGLNYGWDSDNTGHTAIRGSTGSPDFRYDSLAVMQPGGKSRRWEIEVPNGLYEVRVVAGDPSATDSSYAINVEGSRVVTGTPGGETHWFRGTSIINVTDGRLTVTNGSGATNNKIDFIDIKSAPVGAQAGRVTGNLPVDLFSPATASQWTKNSDGLFSDKQIDDVSIWI